MTSARTGQGVEDTARAPGARSRVTSPNARSDDLFRMPIDRVFTVTGTGTVVTGTVISGIGRGWATREACCCRRDVRRGCGRSSRTGVSLERSMPGARTAVALSGVERDDIARGDVLVLAADPWEATTRLDAELTLATRCRRALADRSGCGCTTAPRR